MNTKSYMTLDQFKSGRDLDPRVAKAKQFVDQMQTSMAALAAKDGQAEDKDTRDGEVYVRSSHQWESPMAAQRTLSLESVSFDRKKESYESYDLFTKEESPGCKAAISINSFTLGTDGREHYYVCSEVGGLIKENCQIMIDRAGNLVQFSEVPDRLEQREW